MKFLVILMFKVFIEYVLNWGMVELLLEKNFLNWENDDVWRRFE